MMYSCSAPSYPETAMMTGPDNPALEFSPGTGTEGVPGAETGEGAWSLETLGRVAEGVVHDFNNVLAAISGLAELILHTGPDREGGTGGNPPVSPRKERAREFAEMILQAAASGQGLVKELKTFSRKGRRELEVLDLHEVITQSLAMARGAMGGRIQSVSDFAPGSVRVLGCRGLLQSVFINLFLNARDAMPQGGRITVRTEVREDGEGRGLSAVAVSVRDTGVGMSRDVLERIFERFYTTKGPKGNGLGLANVMRVVESHQGRISVDSQPGQGTEFRIRLPLLP